MSIAGALSERSTAGADLELAQRHRYGDDSAFEEIYQRYSGLVYGLCFRMCGDGQLSQDLSQEIFLRVHKSLHRFRGRSTLKTWVYRVALNHCRSRLSRRRLPTEDLDNPDSRISLRDGRRGPEELAMAHDLGDVVARALLDLPAKFREAVVLRDLEDLSYAEIAVIAKVRVGTVRSRIARGRERLRAVLEKDHAFASRH